MSAITRVVSEKMLAELDVPIREKYPPGHLAHRGLWLASGIKDIHGDFGWFGGPYSPRFTRDYYENYEIGEDEYPELREDIRNDLLDLKEVILWYNPSVVPYDEWLNELSCAHYAHTFNFLSRIEEYRKNALYVKPFVREPIEEINERWQYG